MNQRRVVIYTKGRSWRCWRARRLLARKGYAFEAIDTNEDGLRALLRQVTGRETLPYVFVDDRPVGGLGEIRGLAGSGDLDRLVRGEV